MGWKLLGSGRLVGYSAVTSWDSHSLYSSASQDIAEEQLSAGEAPGIEIDKHVASDFSLLNIRQKARHCKIEQRLNPHFSPEVMLGG
jgi:hypothetical protein